MQPKHIRRELPLKKNIADISAQLATATDDDVITALVSLRDGSENHLRAFNRQL